MSMLLNAKDAAVKLGYTRDALYKAAKRKGIPHVRIDGVIRFDPDDLDKWIALQKAKAKSCPTCGRSIAAKARIH